MSPSMKSKSKSKEKGSAKTSKEQHKGAFQTTETSLVASTAQVHVKNLHFPNTSDTDEHSNSPQGTASECDSVSNNGSCSGESEDPKEKATNSATRLNVMPGCDNDRRDKIRLKNERKHQRQKERRAQELHDRCGEYLMLKKLDALAEKLVAMGFSSERATLALKLNDGKLEESISWLFEGGEEESQTKKTTNPEGNLKIDIGEELVQISAMGVKYNCSNQEVERVVVACEGDLQKAENTLKSQKLKSPVTQSKSQDSAAASVSMQQKGNECDFNYYKVGGAESTSPDPGSRNLQSLHLNHPNELTEKRWGVTGSSPSTMLNMAQSMQTLSPSVKVEALPGSLRNEGRMIQGGVRREALVMMKHPQLTNPQQNSQISINSLPLGTSGWYVNSTPLVENVRSNGKLLHTHMEQLCQAPYKGGFYNPMGASSPSPTISSHHQGLWSNNASSLELTVPSSFGLVSGHQNAARTFSSLSHMDRSTRGMMPEFDYNSVDWSLDCTSSSKSGGLWPGTSSLLSNSDGNRMGSSYITGLQNVGMARDSSSSDGLREWTSPFAGKDMFSVPRQFVTSPSL
ncbi:uncharacterized protein LOC130745357 [Lotus japonicus]|uniref:uncharacterized protein LOC130745357 n=1 Tax=Lotus japonicus TaxID=34305 RepID=UPI00258C86EC|nr:uncharacterized protein LOC130745357 [Lotus japonicus]XP_057453528.1 uncharacterized protein LOC130745357 [Lotus japonicus]